MSHNLKNGIYTFLIPSKKMAFKFFKNYNTSMIKEHY